MTTYESVTADIKQILDAFDNFVNILEVENWLKNLTVEDIKNGFKLTAFVEESIQNLQTKQCVDLFINILIVWWKTNNRTKVYDVQFFSKASDHLLSKFFTSTFVAVNAVDVAVRMYTTLYPKERFENFLTSLTLNSASYEALVDYSIANKNCIDLKELECRLLLRNWSIEVECGRMSNVKSVITNMLSSYKIETCLATLVSILAIKSVNNQEIVIKNIIVKFLQSKMVDRSILSKHFWLNLFKNVDRKELSEVCAEYNDFLKELFDFIVYIGCMMNSEMSNFKTSWISDPNISICPELTYKNLVDLIKCICDCNTNIRSYAELRISQAKSSTNSQLWKQLEEDI